MHRGYVKLWRKIQDSRIIQDRNALQLWTYLLSKANYEPSIAWMNGVEVKLNPGQCLFGRKVAAKELCRTEDEIRQARYRLEKWQMTTSKTTNKFSVITIVNWDIYQSQDIMQHPSEYPTAPPANPQQTPSKPPHLKKAKKAKKVKKEKNKDSIEYPSWLNLDLWQDYREHRKAKKSPFSTPKSENLCIGTLNKLIQAGNEQEAVINQSIERNWIGLFPVQGNTNGGKPKRSYKPKYDWAAAEEELQNARNDSIPIGSQHPQ